MATLKTTEASRRFLEQLGFPRTELSYRVSIHESADVEGAQRWWEQQAGIQHATNIAAARRSSYLGRALLIGG